MADHLFIVSRQQPDLYSYLSREFSSEADVRVIVDRREGERRHQGERRSTPRGDRRQTDRRALGEVSGQISSLGYAFIRVG
jgi:hypothetical protein